MADIAIIGAGPAGIMAAINAAESSKSTLNIFIFDKDEPLKTILWTGNGRCNITNATYDVKKLASNYPRGEKFLYSIFSRFSVQETVNWFNDHGLRLYTQEDNRMFPRSDDANEVRDLLLNIAKKRNIRIRSEASVTKIEQKDDKFRIMVDGEPKLFDKVVIATGGSYRKPNESGYKFAKDFGHKITELRPSLTALISKEKYPEKLAGISIKDAKISAYFENKKVYDDSGDFVFTHKGVSGPLIFKVSAYTAFLNYNELNPLLLKINFIPNIKPDELEKDLLEEFDRNSQKSLINILKKYLPKSLLNELLEINEISPEKKASQITKVDRKTIIKLLTETELNIKSTQQDGEIVTAGGVSLKEINPKTMESKLVKNLYFCGEILDIDGLTGGYNLQACWSTGYIAGISLSE